MFWIAVGFLAAGLFLAPIIMVAKTRNTKNWCRRFWFWALVLVTAGTFIGNWLAIAQVMPEHLSFWFGHQGYEYLDLGRFWQVLKFVGILLWLVLMLRGMLPALKKDGDKNLLVLFICSVIAVRSILRRWFLLRRAHSLVGHGILALVGCTPLGRRLL